MRTAYALKVLLSSCFVICFSSIFYATGILSGLHVGEQFETLFEKNAETVDYNLSENIIRVQNTISQGDTPPMVSNAVAVPTGGYNAGEYKKSLDETLRASPDVKTAFQSKKNFSGLNNQIFRFLGVIFLAANEDFGQILEESITWKDTYGHNDFVPLHKLWDVVHWNSFFPSLPRFVSYDKEQHPHLDLYVANLTIDGDDYPRKTLKYNVNWDVWVNRTITRPQPIVAFTQQSLNKIYQLNKNINWDKVRGEQVKHLELYQEVLKGALRPHPFLQQIVDKVAAELGSGEKGYMTLHSRVELDMLVQNARVCSNRKVYNMTDIISAIYEKYPEPPVSSVLIQFNRALMEREAKSIKQNDKFHDINDNNLKEINKLVEEGMWGGKVKVVEAGSRIVEEAGDPYYKYYSNIAGGIVNLFLAIQSDIMVGTETSTYSVQAINTRHYRGLTENYFYRPEGLHWVTPPNVTKQHRFTC